MDTLDAFNSPDGDNLFAFPDFDIPEAKKDAEWHRRVAMAYIQESQLHNWEYDVINDSYKRFNGLESKEAYKFMMESEDGSALPAVPININGVNPMVKLLDGDLSSRPVQMNVRALNKDAASRLLRKKQEIQVKMDLRGLFEKMEAGTDLKLSSPTVQVSEATNDSAPLPETREELTRLMRDNYKELSEECIQRVLDYFLLKTNWDTRRVEFFVQIPIAARMVAKVEWDNALPVIDKIDPRAFFFDHNAVGDFLDNATHMGSVRYMSATEILSRYNITPKELQEIGSAQSYFYGNRIWTQWTIINRKVYYLVANCEFADTKPMRWKETRDKYGTVHTKEEPDKAHKTPPGDSTDEGDGVYSRPNGDKIIIRRKRTVRYATLIGSKVVEWGELQNQVRSVDDYSLSDSGYSYVAALPYWVDSANVSMVQLIAPIEDLQFITMYRLQLAMAVAGVKGITVDEGELPANLSLKESMHYIKAAGIKVVNRKEEGWGVNGGGGTETWDMTMGDVSGYLLTMKFLDERKEKNTGVSEARQGFVQNSSQAVGVTNASVNQSNLHTNTIYKIFDKFQEKVFTKVVNQFKIAMKRQEIVDHFSEILGDAALAFIHSDVDLALDDYGVFLTFQPQIVQNRDKYEQMLAMGLQTKAITYEDFLELMQEPDTALGLKMLQYRTKKRADEAHAQEMQLAQQQQQAQLMQQQMQSQAAMGVAQQNNQARLQDSALRTAAQERMAHAGNMANLTQTHMEGQQSAMQPPAA